MPENAARRTKDGMSHAFSLEHGHFNGEEASETDRCLSHTGELCVGEAMSPNLFPAFPPRSMLLKGLAVVYSASALEEMEQRGILDHSGKR